MRGMLRHNRYMGKIKYSSVRRYKRNLFLFIVVASTIIIYVTTKLLSRRPVHVLVRFNEKEIQDGFSLIFGNEGYRRNAPEKSQTPEKQKLAPPPTSLSPVATQRSTIGGSSIPKSDVMSKGKTSKWDFNPVNKCKNASPFLVVLITSRETMTSERDTIRQTWCKKKAYPGNRNLICMFLLGDDEERDENTTSELKREYVKHRDIIKQSFVDTFRNSSRKFVMGMEWVTKYCNDVKYVMKTEDDVIVNGDFVMEKLLKDRKDGDYFAGKCWSDSPNRNRKSKFYVSEEDFPRSEFPVYCSRTGYVMSADVTKKMYKASMQEKLLPMDDVYAGVLLERIHVTPTAIPNFLLGRLDTDEMCTHMSASATIHAHGVDVLHVWEKVKRECGKSKRKKN